MTSKKKSRKNIRQFLIDTNLFIAAIKNPKKETNSLRLLLELIDDTTIVLIGNEFLTMEMEKYAQVFESKRGKEILYKLIDKTEVVDVDERFLRLCKSYFPEEELIDIYHAVTEFSWQHPKKLLRPIDKAKSAYHKNIEKAKKFLKFRPATTKLYTFKFKKHIICSKLKTSMQP